MCVCGCAAACACWLWEWECLCRWKKGFPRIRHSAVNRRSVRNGSWRWLQDWRGWRESTCAGGQCQVRQRTRHDTWMTNNFRHTKVCNPEPFDPWATRVRVRKNDQTVQCDVLTHCAHLYMLYEWVVCSHLPSIVGKFISRQPELVLNS